jgi:putative redox protein
MVRMRVEYQGGLRCEATHGPSGNKLLTDAPVDNHGRGESFSPTDLAATGLATCVLTIIGILGERHGHDLTRLSAEVEKIMSTDPPRRIAALHLKVFMPSGLTQEDRARLERAAHTCPVHQSLHPDIEKPIEFVYPD